jgi:hypothetical protein
VGVSDTLLVALGSAGGVSGRRLGAVA